MPSRPRKLRLDELLVARGLFESRNRAQRAVLAGAVRSDTEVLDKPGRVVREDLPLTLLETSPYVGRGAEKLAGFLQTFPLAVEGLDILDVGASTGGFTDYLLQQGAASATCIDVGFGQLHYRLRQDPRVTNLEKVHARDLPAQALPHPVYPLVVADLSFISLTSVLQPIWARVATGGHLIALVKPQFEAGKAEADRGQGVIADPALQDRLVEGVAAFAREHLQDSTLAAREACCLKGAQGNQESFLAWKRVASSGESASAEG